MKNTKTIGIVVVTLVIIVAIIAITITNQWFLNLESPLVEYSTWFPTNLNHTKYRNIFKSFESLFLDSLSLGIYPTISHNIHELGTNSYIVENNSIHDFFRKSIGLGNILVFFAKALKGHSVPPSKPKYTTILDNSVREVKYVMYCFGNVGWEFGDGWLFRKIAPNGNNRYYVPENNSIVVFHRGTTYEWLPLLGNRVRYFMVILIF